jgi:hypothetical protein
LAAALKPAPIDCISFPPKKIGRKAAGSLPQLWALPQLADAFSRPRRDHFIPLSSGAKSGPNAKTSAKRGDARD